MNWHFQYDVPLCYHVKYGKTPIDDHRLRQRRAGCKPQMLFNRRDSCPRCLCAMWALVSSNVGFGSYHVLWHPCICLLAWPLTFECVIFIVLDSLVEKEIIPMGNTGPNQPKVWTHFSSEKVPKFGNALFLPTLLTSASRSTSWLWLLEILSFSSHVFSSKVSHFFLHGLTSLAYVEVIFHSCPPF